MKTLKNQTLLYDVGCPLCEFYTKGFIKTKMLDNNGRKAFKNITESEQNFVDLKRASNEIALIDTKNKSVIYGVDSLLKILGNSFPWMERFGKIKFIHFILEKLYAFISYNRKVIIPNTEKPHQKLQCVPEFNVFYRVLYIIFASLVTTFVLFNFSKLISLLPKASVGRELLLAIGQILFQGLFLFRKQKKVVLNYIGNLMTVSLLGSLILLPVLFINVFFKLPELVLMLWFGMTVIIMFAEHIRRIKILQLPSFLTYTWVLYRIIALLLILNIIS